MKLLCLFLSMTQNKIVVYYARMLLSSQFVVVIGVLFCVLFCLAAFRHMVLKLAEECMEKLQYVLTEQLSFVSYILNFILLQESTFCWCFNFCNFFYSLLHILDEQTCWNLFSEVIFPTLEVSFLVRILTVLTLYDGILIHLCFMGSDAHYCPVAPSSCWQCRTSLSFPPVQTSPL